MATISRTVMAALLCLAVTSANQAADPTEVRVSAQPYLSPLASSAPMIRSESRLVEVPAVVRDEHGRVVPGLRQADFQLFDSGREHAIATFSMLGAAATPATPAASSNPAAATPDRPATRYIALLFDDLVVDLSPLDPRKIRLGYALALGPVQRSGIALLRNAATQFVATQLHPGDLVAILTTSQGQLVPFTRDREALAAGLKKIIGHARDPDQLKTTVLQSIDAVVKSVASLPGERQILLASGGINAEEETADIPTSQTLEQAVITRALAAGVVINALDGKGLYTGTEGALGNQARPARGRESKDASAILAASNKPLEAIAYGTGGLFFHNNNDLLHGMRELIEPEVRYLLGFVPDDASDGRYHSLKLKLRLPVHYSIDARPGYFAPSKGELRSQSQPRRIDREVLSTAPVEGLPITFSSEPGKGKDGAPALRTVFHLDVKRLAFQQVDQRRVQRFTLLAALLDGQGNLVAGKEGVMDLALKDATFAEFSSKGLNGTLQLEAPPGSYQLRMVVEQSSNGKLAAASLAVDVR